MSGSEADLRRRLADVAATTTVDPAAWDRIQARVAASPYRARTRGRPLRPTRVQLVALAAALAVVFGIFALSRHDDGSTTETVDESTTTTGGSRTTTTTREGATTSTTTARDGSPVEPPTGSDAPGAAPGDGAAGGSGSGSGPGAGGPGTTGDPSAPSGGAPSGPGPGSSPAPGGGGAATTQPTSTTTAPAADVRPDGYPVAASIAHSGYTVDLTAYQSGGTYYMNFWRGDAYITMWNWTGDPAQTCLVAEGVVQDSGDMAGLRWGFVRSGVASVRMVTTSGDTASAVVGTEFAPGIRPWIGDPPPGEVDRFEALDAAGNVLHATTPDPWLPSAPC